jgi:glucokinase
MTILAGDIGGTKSLLCICDESLRPVFERRYPSGEHKDFTDIVKKFLAEAGQTPQRACFGIAGPVQDDVCRATNLPWVIEGRALEAATGIRSIRLINDFHANAASVEVLRDEDTVSLKAGTRDPKGPVAILGAGTGLGEAFLFHSGTQYHVVASEGGHADFAPRTEEEIGVLRYLIKKFGGHVSYERILAGKGLVNLYEALREMGHAPESEAVRAEFEREDPPAVVSRRGLDKSDALCDRALSLFCAVYGAEAGNLALKVMASGGVFVAGGIAPKILPRLQDGTFTQAFLDKGRLTRLVEGIPVRVITNPIAPILGAASVASRL